MPASTAFAWPCAAPSETGASLFVQLVRGEHVVADLLTPAGFGWPDVLRAAVKNHEEIARAPAGSGGVS